LDPLASDKKENPMSRLPPVAMNDMTAEQKAVYDDIVGGPRGQVRGPLAVWLHRPELASRAQALGAYCRYGSSLPKRLSELAILITAREWSAEFEWWAHRPQAQEAGLPERIIEAIRKNETPAFAANDERAVYDIATTFYREHRLSDALYARGLAVLGQDMLIDLIGVLGYYAMVSMTINAFNVTPPPGTAPVFANISEA
jgi:4-carboxymuconolactone decarboxylase